MIIMPWCAFLKTRSVKESGLICPHLSWGSLPQSSASTSETRCGQLALDSFTYLVFRNSELSNHIEQAQIILATKGCNDVHASFWNYLVSYNSCYPSDSQSVSGNSLLDSPWAADFVAQFILESILISDVWTTVHIFRFVLVWGYIAISNVQGAHFYQTRPTATAEQLAMKNRPKFWVCLFEPQNAWVGLVLVSWRLRCVANFGLFQCRWHYLVISTVVHVLWALSRLEDELTEVAKEMSRVAADVREFHL